jgi:hypothetical protein
MQSEVKQDEKSLVIDQSTIYTVLTLANGTTVKGNFRFTFLEGSGFERAVYYVGAIVVQDITTGNVWPMFQVVSLEGLKEKD